jgi:hypothetical protein
MKMRDAGWHLINLPGRHREDGGQTTEPEA